MTLPHLTVALPDPAATIALGADLAPLLEPGMRIYLAGDLGAGKTTFTRGLLGALGHKGAVKSPTYTLVEIYVFSAYILYHFDFYRFNDPEEWREAGLDEHFNDTSVCIVEWPEQAAGVLPAPDVKVRFKFETGDSGDSRTVELEALSTRGERCLNALRKERPTPSNT
jgi:tRNA threonylcarbamoyladenosine biosynthesis protein TsaE